MACDSKSKKPKKCPTFGENLSDYFKEWAEKSSLHGVQYFGERDRHMCEKAWWLVVYSVSLYFCTMFILRSYRKWDNAPVILNTEPVWNIPFPAVTVCPANKVRQRLYNYTHYFREIYFNNASLTEKEWEDFNNMMLLCEHDLHYNGTNFSDNESLKFLQKVSPSLTDTMFDCWWMDETYNCSEIFMPVLTADGICFTFNMLGRDDIFSDEEYLQITDSVFYKRNNDSVRWTLEKGYQVSSDSETYPRRTLAAGPKAGLGILLRTRNDTDYLCRYSDEGYKIHFHNPSELPNINTDFLWVPLNQQLSMAVKPDYVTTKPNLREYDVKARHCYFDDERKLRFFKNYTQKNCELECLSNYTYKRCGCVAYYMPHDITTKVCGSNSTKVWCVDDAENLMLLDEFKKNAMTNQGKQQTLACNCHPACTSLNYNVELSQSHFNWAALIKAMVKKQHKKAVEAFWGIEPGAAFTKITVFYKSVQFVHSQRCEVYTACDFLASCGGLLSLFIGLSFFSVLEMLYFATLRVWYNIRIYGLCFWASFTRVKIFFKLAQFISTERCEVYDTVDFLACCGGLFGLFIGLSAVSVIETIYFATLRLYCNIWRFGSQFWSGSKRLIEKYY